MDDILSSNARKVFPEYNTANYRTYNQQVISDADDYLQHGALKMAVGVVRLVANCQLREELYSGNPQKTFMPYVQDHQKTTQARDLYCRSFGDNSINDRWDEVKGICP
ncbi:MAG: hypothetical protein NXH97_20960 [Rhodobacteraceae bacterium]|nr:hypothetical protein [Paracoccaceae bacterium]